jgi:hypothetical protein
MTQFLAQIVFVVSGAPVALLFVRSPGLRLGLELFCGALIVLSAGVVTLAWFRGGLSSLERGLLRIRRFREWWASGGQRWRQLIADAVGSLRRHPGNMALSIGAALLGWQAGVIETFLILRLLEAPVSWLQAYAIEVLSVAIEGALFFVPAKMGTQEGGKVLIFVTMGLDPSKGLALGFIRRLREFAWAIIGLVALGWFQRPQPLRAPAAPSSPMP